MRLQRQSNKEIINLNLASTLGHGGEARVYGVSHDQRLVAKVYYKPTEAQAQKLLAMLVNSPENPTAEEWHIAIAWPVDLLRTVDSSQRVVGFLMPRVKGMHSLLDFYNPKTRRQKCPFFNYHYLHRTARNLAAAVGALHARGYCIGDVNESNILVSDTALVTLVDTDSFQVREPDSGVVYRCPVGKPEFTPPELQSKSFGEIDRVPEHDLFGLAVLIFQLLMEGTHPFSGIYQGIGDPPPYEARIKAGHFSYSLTRKVPYRPTPIAPAWEILHPSLRKLFQDCFESGHNNPQLRPNAQTWQSALNEAENALVICAANNQHRYGNHLKTCPWCERTLALGGRDPFPSLQAVQKKEHLQPIKPKRVSPLVQRGLNIPPHRTLPTQLPLLGTTPTKKRFSPFVLGWLGVTVMGLLDILLIVRVLNLTTGSGPIYKSTTSDIASPNSLTNSDNSSISYSKQSHAAYKLGDYEGVIENFNQALRLNPNDAKAYVNRGNVHYEIARHSGTRYQEYRAAIEDFNQALRLNPNDAKTYVIRGIMHYEIAPYSDDSYSNYKAAIEDFNQALRLNPQDAETYVKRGIVRSEMALYSGDSYSNYRTAIEDFNQALRLNPQNAEAYIKRGTVRYEVAPYSGNSYGVYREAVEDLHKAAKLFFAQGDIDHYQQALAICQRQKLDDLSSCQ